MRRLTSFDDPMQARALCEALYAANIDSDLREGPDRTATVWVLAEHDMDRAQGILNAFVARPYVTAPARASHPPPQQQPQQAIAVKKTLRDRIRESPVTFGMIGICIGVAIVTQLGNRADMVSYLAIASFERSGSMLRWYGYRDLLDGQVWRLITPIFIHFGPFHLLFNSFWMNDLGAPTERIQGSFRHAFFVLWCAAASNLAQLVFGHSPTFGGMSGIVYAYVGYLWARGRVDPACGIYLPGRLVVFFVALMALGFSAVLDEYVGAMANYAHLGGFLAGLAHGGISGLYGRARRG